MKHLSQQETPLYTALTEYAGEDIVHFDVPGHKKRNNPELVEDKPGVVMVWCRLPSNREAFD